MSDVVKIGTWENELLSIKLTYIKIRSKFWFTGKNAAESLAFTTNPNLAIKNHVFYDYKITFKEFYDLHPSFVEKFKTDYFNQFHIWPKKSQILINELGFYQLASKSTSKNVEPFQRWVYETITTIREKGFYCLPEIENLSLEDRKETTEYLVEHDIPDFVFIDPCGNLERKKYRDLLKEGYDKSKDLIQVNLGSIGGKKSARNTKRARDFVKNLGSEDKKSLSKLSRGELYDYISDLIDICASIMKDFKS